jgi:SNF2 family DNA or RNA helicase
MEILSGYAKLENDEIIRFKENPRLDVLMEKLTETKPHKVIIFCVFKNNYEDIRKALDKKKIKFVELHGEIDQKTKAKNIDLFNDLENDIRVCIANPQSGGVGVNLKSARYTIFFTRSFSMKDYEQSRARNYRSGSIEIHNKITHYNLVTSNTVDEKAYNAIIEKKEIASSLLDLKELLM